MGAGLDAGAGITCPVTIAIDEAQRFTDNKDTSLAKLLQGLHDNFADLPFTLVLAGLGDTAA